MTTTTNATVSTIKTTEQVKSETTRRTVSTLLTLAGITPGGATLTEDEINALLSAMRPMLATYTRATGGEVATTKEEQAMLDRLARYFARKGAINAKGERNTVELDMACELCDVEADALRGAIRSANSNYRFFRGDSIGLRDDVKEEMVKGIVKAPSSSPSSSPSLPSEAVPAPSPSEAQVALRSSAKRKGDAARAAAAKVG